MQLFRPSATGGQVPLQLAQQGVVLAGSEQGEDRRFGVIGDRV